MKKGDRVYIRGMEGGPHIISEIYIPEAMKEWAIPVNINGAICFIHRLLIEPAEPEVEEGRLVYVWDELGAMGELAIPYDSEARTWKYKKPVHRRWDDLNNEEKEHLGRVIDYYSQDDKDVYKLAYKLITGEEHP